MPVVTVPDAAVGFDTDTQLTATALAELRKDYAFAARYLSLSTPQEDGDLDSAELADILDSGMGLMAVQHCLAPLWSPTGALGMTMGRTAAANAKSVGLAQGAMVALDWEGIEPRTNISKAVAFVNNWTAAVRGAGYQACIYVGYDCLFTAHQLYYDLGVSLYWASMSSVPTPEVRGFCMQQSPTVTVSGVSLDPDLAWRDNRGDAPSMMVR